MRVFVIKIFASGNQTELKSAFASRATKLEELRSLRHQLPTFIFTLT
jgi:hypothetical protein